MSNVSVSEVFNDVHKLSEVYADSVPCYLFRNWVLDIWDRKLEYLTTVDMVVLDCYVV